MPLDQPKDKYKFVSKILYNVTALFVCLHFCTDLLEFSVGVTSPFRQHSLLDDAKIRDHLTSSLRQHIN